MVAPESPTARKQRHEGRPTQDVPLHETSTIGAVPPDNRPGHTPEHQQDRPPLDKFAERLGLRPAHRSGDEADHGVAVQHELARSVGRLGDRGAAVMRASRRAASAALGRLADAVDPGPRRDESS
jgi:hypothetical protein